MKALELREKSADELNQLLLDKLHEQFKLRMQLTTRQLTQTHLLKQVRKDIARINTLLTEKAGN